MPAKKNPQSLSSGGIFPGNAGIPRLLAAPPPPPPLPPGRGGAGEMRRQLMSKIQGAVAKRWEFEVEVEVGLRGLRWG